MIGARQGVEAIRETLRKLERDPEVHSDDPTFDALKRLLLRWLLELDPPKGLAREAAVPEPAVPAVPETTE
jgi:hypothetical protein